MFILHLGRRHNAMLQDLLQRMLKIKTMLTTWMTVRVGWQERNKVFTRSSKLPANFQQMYSKCTWIAGRLLDRVNTPKHKQTYRQTDDT